MSEIFGDARRADRRGGGRCDAPLYRRASGRGRAAAFGDPAHAGPVRGASRRAGLAAGAVREARIATARGWRSSTPPWRVSRPRARFGHRDAMFSRRGWAVFPRGSGACGTGLRHATRRRRPPCRIPDRRIGCGVGARGSPGSTCLPNDAAGAVAGSGPLGGTAVRFIEAQLGLTEIAWDRAQVSVVYPGYPRRGEGETDAAFRVRRDRDAAHVDGLLPMGPGGGG